MAGEGEIAEEHLLKTPGLAQLLLRVLRLLWPSWLVGPIFDKELRVSSRRRRNYVLRFVYLVLLSIFVVLVWLSEIGFADWGGSVAFRTSRMAEAGQTIILYVVWFQFCAMQLVAVIMMSNAISDEIHHRTLGVLMTTPISSLQIVMGKLFSKLWQLLILVGISLPLLAVVRVLGGVPWEFLISGVCITLSAVVFAGVVSLYFSVRNRRAYAVILKTLFVGGVLYAFIPWLLYELRGTSLLADWLGIHFSRDEIWAVILSVNPVVAMVWITEKMLRPGMISPYFSWPMHCGIMLGLSAAVLALVVAKVRKVSLHQATGGAGTFNLRKQRRLAARQAVVPTGAELPTVPAVAVSSRSPAAGGRIRRVAGSPVAWKELRAPLLRGGRRTAIIGVLAALAALAITYAVCGGDLDDDGTHMAYVMIFMILGVICTTVLSATSITAEKESRSWPILLVTPLSDWQILYGKAVGTFRRVLPIWLLLAVHVAIFVFVGFIHPIAIVHLFMLVAWLVVFLTGSGLYFSARFKRTTSAVVMNIGLVMVIWLIVPALMGLAAAILLDANIISDIDDDDFLASYVSANPLIQAGAIMDGAAGRYNAKKALHELDYDWPDDEYRSASGSTHPGKYDSVGETTSRIFDIALFYAAAGAVFALLAKLRLRRRIF